MASKLTPAQRVALARHPERPGTADFIKHLFTDFFEQRGDRLCAEDGSILGGVALFHGKPVTVVGHRKGRSLEENLSLHFGMPSPEGYRKASGSCFRRRSSAAPSHVYRHLRRYPAWSRGPRPGRGHRPESL